MLKTQALNLDDLKASPQWVCWRMEKRNEKLTKVPYNPYTGKRAESDDPETWSIYERAQEMLSRAKGYYQGLGFMFCPTMLPVMGIDLDHCVENGQIAPWAKEHIDLISSYAEYSPSKTGVHVLAQGVMPEKVIEGKTKRPGRKRTFKPEECKDGRDQAAAVEMYCEGRFFTVTGDRLPDLPAEIMPRQQQINELYNKLFSKRQVPEQKKITRPASALDFSDQELLEKARAARNGQEFDSLWRGNAGPDESQADFHLCSMLAFWTGKDATRMDHLFRQSGLMREKWDEHRGELTYGKLTINNAIDACTEVYTGSNGSRPLPVHQEREGGLPDIICGEGQLRDQTKEVLASLDAQERAQPSLFVRSAKMVRIVEDEERRPIIVHLGESELRGVLTRAANYYRLKSKGDEVYPVPIPPPKDIVHDILGLDPAKWPFRPLISVIEAPTMRPDGTIISSPGYDSATRLYYHPQRNMERCQVSERPTRGDVEQALALIWDSFGEFSFADQADKANTLAALLTPLVRPIIKRHVPLALLNAPKQGTGKGLLSDGISVIATGKTATILTAPENEDEWDKRITAMLLAGKVVITIDNLTGKLQSGRLDAVLTADLYEGRILGQSAMVSIPNRATWIATGNNIRLGGDLPRRCYQIRLDPHVSRPWMRSGFKHEDLISHIVETRAEHVAALLTLARYWFISGKPLDTSLPKLGTFTSWVQTIGGILLCAGVPGFLGNLEKFYDEADEDSSQWEAFLLAWEKTFGSEWIEAVKITELVKQSKGESGGLFESAGSSAGSDQSAGSVLSEALPTDLQLALDEKSLKSFTIRLGKALEKRIDTCYGDRDLRIERSVNKHTGTKKWRVVAGSAGSSITQHVNENSHTQYAVHTEEQKKKQNGNGLEIYQHYQQAETPEKVPTGLESRMNGHLPSTPLPDSLPASKRLPASEDYSEVI